MNTIFKHPTGNDVEPQYAFDVESNVLWVDTLYWTFKTDFTKMKIKHGIQSKYVKLSYLPGDFYLNMERTSPGQILVELVRDLDEEESAHGYELQVSFTLVASPSLRKITYLDYDINNAPVYFTLDELLSLYCLHEVLMIKCVVWMREESSPLNNDRRKEQFQLWKTKLKEISPTHNQYQQMAFIMGRECFREIFTGRQDYKFADLKATLLTRSFRYSDRLFSKISEPQRGMQSEESIEDLGRLLGYIKNGQERCIGNKDCILLYASAFFCGLSYLKMQCSDYIKMNLNLNEIDFFLDVVTVSDMVNDQDLLNYASSWFLRNKKKVLKSVQWINFKNRNYELVRGFRFTFLRYELHEQEDAVEHVSSLQRIDDDEA